MDTVMQPGSLFALTAWILLQLLQEPQYAVQGSHAGEPEEETDDPFARVHGSLMGSMHDVNSLFSVGLYNYRFCTMFSMFDEDLGF